MAAHTAGHLVSAHMKLGRQKSSGGGDKKIESKKEGDSPREAKVEAHPVSATPSSIYSSLNKKANNDFPRLPTP